MRGLMRRFLSVRGVAPRREWWFAYLVTLVINMAVVAAMMAMDALYGLMDVALDRPLVGGLISLVMVLPIVPASVRRMRDRRLSSWWLAAFAAWVVLAPYVVRLADGMDALMIGNVIQIAGVIGSLILFVQLAVLPSKTPPPEPEAAA